jgi:hypothetical protein
MMVMGQSPAAFPSFPLEVRQPALAEVRDGNPQGTQQKLEAQERREQARVAAPVQPVLQKLLRPLAPPAEINPELEFRRPGFLVALRRRAAARLPQAQAQASARVWEVWAKAY